jgi:hypothetical protein
VTIRRYLWPHEAQLARSVLDGAGIDAVVQDQYLAQADWLYVQAIGGLRLQVASGEAARPANGRSTRPTCPHVRRPPAARSARRR